MTTTTTKVERSHVNEQILDAAQDSLLDLVDNLLNRGVVVRGDVVLGVAGVDLVYLQLNALLCAADRLLPEAQKQRPTRTTTSTSTTTTTTTTTTTRKKKKKKKKMKT